MSQYPKRYAVKGTDAPPEVDAGTGPLIIRGPMSNSVPKSAAAPQPPPLNRLLAAALSNCAALSSCSAPSDPSITEDRAMALRKHRS